MVSNAFKVAVAAGKVRLVRIMMKDSLLVDPSFVEFGEMNNIAMSLPGLYDQHDGRTLTDDLDAEMVSVVFNFSKERLECLKGLVTR